ncbi:unnamed protein product [Rotaria sordida]|uniref:EF-hand domain-containing protein n=1 Tax=Rotaria sordida TaxID=392033 RepID=A0A814TE48_9BILA|nr:unnamed protein product [Rotaria sordida]CAF1409599.1 unnamed protein product [Rotaria sordida]
MSRLTDQQLEKEFKQMDKNNDKSVTIAELRSYYIPMKERFGVSSKAVEQDVQRYLKRVDTDRNGKISFQEFKFFMQRKNELILSDGLIIECGVGTAVTTNYIAKNINSNRIVYGFDSFEVENNVEIIIGIFEDTLPDLVNKHNNDKIALLHIDCDLYSSTKTVFNYLGKLLGPKSIIVFDEFWNYNGYEEHECKAFYEWLINENKLNSFKWIGYCSECNTTQYIKKEIFPDPFYGPTFLLSGRVSVQLI